MNGDGALDLVVANSVSHDVSVLLNAGDGTYGEQVRYAAGDGPRSVALGDVNGDGTLDMAVANQGRWDDGCSCYVDDDVSVLLNAGDGTFGQQVSYAAGSYPTSVAVGDLDGDGAADLVVANIWSDDVSVLMNRGDGTFAEEVRYAAMVPGG